MTGQDNSDIDRDDDDRDDRDDFGSDRTGGLEDDERDGCQLGERCCCPHPYHRYDECFDAEWAEQYFADTGEQPK